ncbi:FUSC family protein [Martelella sp. HB161492]|uniref:FUSC family protein n=1 Tax=Martelella sp. HB161492 TaxID=2720726 RepID=UPI0015902DEE|nr:FUSC family protein [Martelella sp. HB161492]
MPLRNLTLRPAAWVRSLALVAPAAYRPWRHALRLAIATSMPLFLGLMAGQTEGALYVALGGFLTAVAVRLDPYRERFRQIAISTLVGLSGCLIGPQIAGHGYLTLALLVLIAFLSGLISGYGAAFSTGAMNMLVLAVVVTAVPAEGSIYRTFLEFLSGAGFVCLLLGIGALMDRDRPERRTLARIFDHIAEHALAVARVMETQSSYRARRELVAARRGVTDITKTAYSSLIEKRSHSRARTRYVLHAAEMVSLANHLNMVIIAGRATVPELRRVASWLQLIADAVEKDQREPPPPPVTPVRHPGPAPREIGELMRATERLVEAIWSSRAEPVAAEPRQEIRTPLISTRIAARFARRLILGREVVISAAKLALCIGIAVIAGHFKSGDHSYWLPMTVAIVLKPDFGSVFVRAIHRSIGTVLGVLLGTTIAFFVPAGYPQIICIAALCAILPFAGLRSYALMVTFITPIILLMIDVVVPGHSASYGLQRLVDTVLGSAIALIFGYMIWPRSQGRKLNEIFATALTSVGAYLDAATAPVPSRDGLPAFHRALSDAEWLALRRLSDLRTQLQRFIAEPPPAGREAAAWFPAVAGAERLCDRITAYAEDRTLDDPPPEEVRLEDARAALLALADPEGHPRALVTATRANRRQDSFAEVESEIARLCELAEANRAARKDRPIRPQRAGRRWFGYRQRVPEKTAVADRTDA